MNNCKIESMKSFTEDIIDFTCKVLVELKDEAAQERHSRMNSGVCGIYQYWFKIDLRLLVKLYNEESYAFLKIFDESLTISPPRCNNYLITIPKALYDDARNRNYGFKGEMLKKRIHFLTFILNKLREVDAYLHKRSNYVKEEVLEWVSSHI